MQIPDISKHSNHTKAFVSSNLLYHLNTLHLYIKLTEDLFHKQMDFLSTKIMEATDWNGKLLNFTFIIKQLYKSM